MIECPYCGFKSTTIFGVKKHIQKTHDIRVCPVCGAKVKNLAMHLYKYDDKEHKKAYAIIGNSHSRYNKKLRKVRDEIIG
jgi:DNA-directed RNA polymerase subunit RPC12/RpoP